MNTTIRMIPIVAAMMLVGCSMQLPPAPPTAQPRTATEQARESKALAGDALVNALRRGGNVIYFRHAATDRTAAEGTTTTLQDCSTQRNLNDKGIAESQAIGEAFERLAIPIGSILSSGYCRARDTASLAFGRVDEVVPDLTGFIVEERERRIATLRRLLSTVPLSNTNTVIVAHGANIANAAQVSLAEGEAAIFLPDGKGFTVLGQVRPEQWRELMESYVNASTEIVTTTYAPSDENFLNPERGFFEQRLSNSKYFADALDVGDLRQLRRNGLTLVRRLHSLSKFRAAPISDDYLKLIAADFDAARQAGVKLIVRFAYAFNEPDNVKDDAKLDVVLSHIEQLAPVLRAGADVIAHMEAGFIGNWGEWHSSTNGLDNNYGKRQVLQKLLDVLPRTRAVAVRYQKDKVTFAQSLDPLTPEEAFSGSDTSRIGHHNDCFLASEDDWGTYWPLDEKSLEQQKNYLNQDNRFVVQSGETCNFEPPRSDCVNALRELAQMRWSSINIEFEENVLNGWRKQGCMGEIERRLGYRLRLTQSMIPSVVSVGGPFSMTFEVVNDGWASPYNPRGLTVVLRNTETGAQHTVLLNDDPRRWLAGETHQVAVSAQLPSSLAPGTYDVFLYLPDPEPVLKARPEYAIRLANQNVWEEATGYNLLMKGLKIIR